jgi:crotonobetainyl-CoA:carnitine CoA-transferase CaiB-like acyl-CoA transferase
MQDVLSGIRVLEVASWTFVPAAGAVLADWGADVLKIEHPTSGDPQRGLITSGLLPGGANAINFIMEQPNRGKRSVAIDIATAGGRELLYQLVDTSDVFLTNFREDARQRLQIDVEHIRARNPNIVYVRGTGQGARGPEASRGGYDAASYFARGGVADGLTPSDAEWPVSPTAAFGDLPGGMTIAGGIAAALLRRERTGVASVVDVSLLGLAMWTMSPAIIAAKLYGITSMPRGRREQNANPIVGTYRTSDGRFLSLIMLESDRYWADLCRHVGRPELAEDPRFVNSTARADNRVECTHLLDEVFAGHTLAEWREILAPAKGVWAVVQNASELLTDPQAVANGYLRDVDFGDGRQVTLVANPVQFDETPPDLTPCPEHGQHTEEVLLELGLDWDAIVAHKEAGDIL